MNYGPGAHSCNPVKIDNSIVNYYRPNCISFHCKNLSAEYLISRNKFLEKRLSETNKRYGLGIHYLCSEKEIESGFNNGYNEAETDLNNCILRNL